MSSAAAGKMEILTQFHYLLPYLRILRQLIHSKRIANEVKFAEIEIT